MDLREIGLGGMDWIDLIRVSTQPITEMSTGNLLRAKGRQAHKTDSVTAIREPIV
jgi:hypothetical protein